MRLGVLDLCLVLRAHLPNAPMPGAGQHETVRYSTYDGASRGLLVVGAA